MAQDKDLLDKLIKSAPAFPVAQLYSNGLRAGWSGVLFPPGAGNFLITTASRPALGPTQPPIIGVRGALSLKVKRAGRGAGHSPPSSAKVKNAWSYTPLPNTSSWSGAQL
jgi:hypothetical protein